MLFAVCVLFRAYTSVMTTCIGTRTRANKYQYVMLASAEEL